MSLDRTDVGILKALQREGRLTKAKLADLVHLSPSPVWERVRRLEKSGVIAGYHARLAVRKIAPATTVIVAVVLRQHRAADFARFETEVCATPEIVDCQSTGGGIDYMLKVVAPRDVDAYQRLMDRLLSSDLQIERYYSYIVTKPVKEAGEVPLDLLLGGEPR